MERECGPEFITLSNQASVQTFWDVRIKNGSPFSPATVFQFICVPLCFSSLVIFAVTADCVCQTFILEKQRCRCECDAATSYLYEAKGVWVTLVESDWPIISAGTKYFILSKQLLICTPSLECASIYRS